MSVFFSGDESTSDTSAAPGIMAEVACEPEATCVHDQYAYKGLTAQWMGEAVQVAPFLTDKIMSYLQSSAQGAAQQCSGGHNGTTCGTQWTESDYDGNTGLGQELSALSVFLANLAANSSAPINVNTTVATQTSEAQASGSTSSSTGSTSTSGTSTATASPRPSSASQHFCVSGAILALAITAALLSF